MKYKPRNVQIKKTHEMVGSTIEDDGFEKNRLECNS